MSVQGSLLIHDSGLGAQFRTQWDCHSGEFLPGLGLAPIQHQSTLDHPILSIRPEERARIYQLCALILLEKEMDRHRFSNLVEELNELLEPQERRLEGKPPTQASTIVEWNT